MRDLWCVHCSAANDIMHPTPADTRFYNHTQPRIVAELAPTSVYHGNQPKQGPTPSCCFLPKEFYGLMKTFALLLRRLRSHFVATGNSRADPTLSCLRVMLMRKQGGLQEL